MKMKHNNGGTAVLAVPAPDQNPRVERNKARLASLLAKAEQSRCSMEHWQYYASLAEVHVRLAEAQSWIDKATDPVAKAEAKVYKAEQWVALERAKFHRLSHLKAVEQVKREDAA